MTADEWARREGFSPEQLIEFRHLLKLALTKYIPKYLIQGWKPIDNGSFGQIYACTLNNQDVAVKEIGQAQDGQSGIKLKMRDLQLELRILVLIKHENIVEYFGTAVDFSKSFSRPPSINLVFGMCHGGSLHNALFGKDYDRLEGRGLPIPRPADSRLNPLLKIRIALEVSQGLEYLHSMLILHRDLNTRNVSFNEHLDSI